MTKFSIAEIDMFISITPPSGNAPMLEITLEESLPSVISLQALTVPLQHQGQVSAWSAMTRHCRRHGQIHQNIVRLNHANHMPLRNVTIGISPCIMYTCTLDLK